MATGRLARVRALCTVVAMLASVALPATAELDLRDIVFVGNGEGGTVDLIDVETQSVVRTIDVVPDGRAPSPAQDPLQAAAFPLVVGAAGDNFAQDLDVSPDGTTLYVSRGHRGDVAAFDIATGTLLWRASVGGFRADHMVLSHDGTRLFVSAITESTVEVLEAADGTLIGTIPTGEWSHDDEMSPDGARVYNGSIGNVLLPEEARARPQQTSPTIRQPYLLTVADAQTLEVERTIAFEAGVRPFVITGDETRLYAQLSEFHGVVEVDLTTDTIPRRLELPIDDGVTEDDYDFEAPHHGIAMSGDENHLCIAGRASDYVAIVSRHAMAATHIVDVDDAPGWATSSPDGTLCYAASTRADTVSVVRYADGVHLATIPVGDGPKYLASARIPAAVVGG